MADQTTNLDTLASNQSGKEARVNALIDAASPSTLGGRRDSTTSGLTWGYYGGLIYVGTTPTAIANGTLSLTASATNYVELNPSTGAITVNTSGFTAGRAPLYQITAGTSTVTSYLDRRAYALQTV